MFCFCIVIAIGFLSVALASETRARLTLDVDKTLDEFYAVDFMKHEYKVKRSNSPSLFISKDSFSYNVNHRGKKGRITYIVILKDGIYRVVRIGLSGEGNNYLFETEKEVHFSQDGKVFSIVIGDITYDLGVSE
ncbi:hypothetical protein AS005_00665 [Thermotoga sp. KOL6]|nr:hypothetical protein AS005_00665 [Thermotoga sp. KOL6]